VRVEALMNGGAELDDLQVEDARSKLAAQGVLSPVRRFGAPHLPATSKSEQNTKLKTSE